LEYALSGEIKGWIKCFTTDARNVCHYYFTDAGIVAWAVVFEKDAEERFSLIVKKGFQRSGLGSRLLRLMLNDREYLEAWVIDHNNDVLSSNEKYISPLPFYLKNGFNIIPGVRIDNELISAVKISSAKK
jgi:GNAT superfamily N-acetyltransferase